MSMHLEGPWLSTTGKKKGKKKFASAEHARRARELKEQWEASQRRWAEMSPNFSKGLGSVRVTKKVSPVVTSGPVIDPRRDTRQYPSLDTGGVATKPAPKVYTGDKIVGIGTMHKSNMVPIFSNQEAEDISKMRRN